MNKTRSGTLAYGRGAAGSLVSELSGVIGLQKLELVQSCSVRGHQGEGWECEKQSLGWGQRCQVGVAAPPVIPVFVRQPELGT